MSLREMGGLWYTDAAGPHHPPSIICVWVLVKRRCPGMSVRSA